jgi:hypothetical protein
MQASHTVDEQLQMQVQNHWFPVPSQLELELRYQLLDIDRRLEIQRCEAYRAMVFTIVAGRHPSQLLPVPLPQRELIPIPVGYSSSSSAPSVAQATVAVADPHGAVAAPAACQWERRPALPSPVAPSNSSSQFPDGSSGRDRGRVRGGRGGQDRGGRAGAVSSMARRHLVYSLFSFCFFQLSVPLTSAYPFCRSMRNYRVPLATASRAETRYPLLPHHRPCTSSSHFTKSVLSH